MNRAGSSRLKVCMFYYNLGEKFQNEWNSLKLALMSKLRKNAAGINSVEAWIQKHCFKTICEVWTRVCRMVHVVRFCKRAKRIVFGRLEGFWKRSVSCPRFVTVKNIRRVFKFDALLLLTYCSDHIDFLDQHIRPPKKFVREKLEKTT